MASHEDSHGSPVRTYFLMLVFLGIVTILEVGTYFMPSLQARPTLLFTILSVMAVVKFVGVVGWYMHLKYDAQYYRRIFAVPLIGAVLMVVVVALLTATKYMLG